MIKNCIIYKYSDESLKEWELDKNCFEEASLGKCLQLASGFTKRKLEAYMNLVKNERISLEEEAKNYYTVKFSCEFRAPKLIAAGAPPPFVPVNINIWVRKKSGFVISFDAGRKLSESAIALLSYIATEDPSSIEQIRLEKEDFLRLMNWILADSHSIPSGIKRITMHDVDEGGIKFKQIVLNSSRLENSPLFNRLLNSASVITNLGFITPPLSANSRPLSCRVNYWGGLTIYTPDLLASEISELIGVFETLLVRGDK
jgi:hypothetical protein